MGPVGSGEDFMKHCEWAVTTGNMAHVARQLKEGWQVNELLPGVGLVPLELALLNGHGRVAALLLDNGANHILTVQPAKDDGLSRKLTRKASMAKLDASAANTTRNLLRVDNMKKCLTNHEDKSRGKELCYAALQRTSHPILLALQLAQLYQNLANRKDQKSAALMYLQLRDEICSVAIKTTDFMRYEDLTVCLNTCDEETGKSPIDIALEDELINFIATPSVYFFLANEWNQALDRKNRWLQHMPWLQYDQASFLLELESCLLQPVNFFNSSHTKFYFTMMSYMAFLALFCFCLRGRGQEGETAWNRGDSWKVVPRSEEYMVVIIMISYVMQEGGELMDIGLSEYLESVWNGIDLCMILLFFTVTVSRAAAVGVHNGHLGGDTDSILEFSSVAASSAAILMWVRLLNMFSTNRLLGPLLIVIQQLLGVFVMYVGVLFVVISGFATACSVLFSDTTTVFDSWYTSFVTLVQTLFGYGGDVFDQARDVYPYAGPTILFLYIFIGMVMLLNLLIAILSHYYEAVAQESQHRWLYLLAVEMAEGHRNPLLEDLPAPWNLPAMTMHMATAPLKKFFSLVSPMLEKELEDLLGWLESAIAFSTLFVTLYVPVALYFLVSLLLVSLVLIPAHYLWLKDDPAYIGSEDSPAPDAPKSSSADQAPNMDQRMEKREGDMRKSREALRAYLDEVNQGDIAAQVSEGKVMTEHIFEGTQAIRASLLEMELFIKELPDRILEKLPGEQVVATGPSSSPGAGMSGPAGGQRQGRHMERGEVARVRRFVAERVAATEINLANHLNLLHHDMAILKDSNLLVHREVESLQQKMSKDIGAVTSSNQQLHQQLQSLQVALGTHPPRQCQGDSPNARRRISASSAPAPGAQMGHGDRVPGLDSPEWEPGMRGDPKPLRRNTRSPDLAQLAMVKRRASGLARKTRARDTAQHGPGPRGSTSQPERPDGGLHAALFPLESGSTPALEQPSTMNTSQAESNPQSNPPKDQPASAGQYQLQRPAPVASPEPQDLFGMGYQEVKSWVTPA